MRNDVKYFFYKNRDNLLPKNNNRTFFKYPVSLYIRIMSAKPLYHLNLVIDDLTNSIRAVADGSVHETEISLATKADMKLATKRNKWHFPWNTEFTQTDRKVYKLIKATQPEVIQGLISMSDLGDHVYVHLAESAPINFGPNKLHEGVGGNLFAFSCKTSWDNGNNGIISFQSKTRLITHYEQTLDAVHIGGRLMVIYPEAALILIKQYFKN